MQVEILDDVFVNVGNSVGTTLKSSHLAVNVIDINYALQRR